MSPSPPSLLLNHPRASIRSPRPQVKRPKNLQLVSPKGSWVLASPCWSRICRARLPTTSTIRSLLAVSVDLFFSPSLFIHY
ncbi:hypothetical protein K438DRAFT_1055345 [Mycena galopus ATCC 62051]|nr:hypothetical protein K438DRAFT_1055345 [Mycena galopus ATCC 62051]